MGKKVYNNIESTWYGYYDQLLMFIIKRVSDKATAEDILQNVFIKILSTIKSLKDNTKIKNRLFQITRNAVIDHYRESLMLADIAQKKWLSFKKKLLITPFFVLHS